MSGYGSKPIHGIVAIIDIVDFTPQVVKLGNEAAAKFAIYFSDEVKKILKETILNL
ncbi:MAG: hypothetical protein HQK94_09860 [Nitrospirae bacterium]|nr:hypothetical protein [Nitrospirota bacterium]MBF0536155.1 hypothetical protein [Nitrospirota bacterium]